MLLFLYADGKRHSCLPVCGTCVWLCAQIPEKHRAKPCFALQTKTLLVSLDMGWESWKGGGRCGALPVVSYVRVHLNKSFVSAEAWNVRLCCGFEVQINVRRESTRSMLWRGGRWWLEGGVKGLGRLEFKWRRLLPPVVPQQTSLPETIESSGDDTQGRERVSDFSHSACCLGALERMISGSWAHVSGGSQLPPCWLLSTPDTHKSPPHIPSAP